MVSLGYSAPVFFHSDQPIKVDRGGEYQAHHRGPDRQVVGEVAAEIRNFYRPNRTKAKACAIRMSA